MFYYAHSDHGPEEGWQRLEDHLSGVAETAGEFAAAFGARDWGYLAGLWHDLGKFSTDFQTYLKSQNEACAETLKGRVDHSSAGAQFAVEKIPVIGHMLGYAIAGHHAGLLDGRAVDACQEKRLCKPTSIWRHGLGCLPAITPPSLPDFVARSLRDPFSVAFFVRMLFSCLADADFLDTERVMNLEQFTARKEFPSLESLTPHFFQALEKLEELGRDRPLAGIRRDVRAQCEWAADLPPYCFSLTVPTGGGKTLSSMAFALRHARRWNMRRVVYVLPFTTIIEQNAAVFRRFLGPQAVLEHHSNLDPTRESRAARLASENWNAPVTVTTSVQFYESLFANRPSACRKLHRLARSIIVLDEAQTLPVEYLKPCLRVLRELVENYHCSIVLCTATQPAVRRRSDFDIGLDKVREIMTDPTALYARLKRVKVVSLGPMTDADLRERLMCEKKVLCIVNTTRHARLLFEALGEAEGHFHLSARMCPAHRRVRLRQIRSALDRNKVCRVVSTQVVEAGVDLDFPVVYRAMAGLDSIAQAAGRCNRNSTLKRIGKVFVFTSEHVAANRYFADTANCAAQVMELHPDPLDLEANERFFKLYYWDQKLRWDFHGILDRFHLEKNRDFPFNFSFATVAKDVRLIDNSATCTVIVPWKRRGRDLCTKLRSMHAPNREMLRRVQAFSVRVYRAEWDAHVGKNIRLVYDNLGILESSEIHYDDTIGISMDRKGAGFYTA